MCLGLLDRETFHQNSFLLYKKIFNFLFGLSNCKKHMLYGVCGFQGAWVFSYALLMFKGASLTLHNFSGLSWKQAAGPDSTPINATNTDNIHKTLQLIFAEIVHFWHLSVCKPMFSLLNIVISFLHRPTAFIVSVNWPVGMPLLLFIDLLKMSLNRLCKDNKEWHLWL